jgi:hypothetical protein
MQVNKRAAIIAVVLALPFVALASDAWIRAATDRSFPAYEADHFGDMIYFLGSPLTLIVLGLPYFAGVYLKHAHDWIWIPLIDLLFVLQWVIWSQLLCAFAKPRFAARQNRLG